MVAVSWPKWGDGIMKRSSHSPADPLISTIRSSSTTGVGNILGLPVYAHRSASSWASSVSIADIIADLFAYLIDRPSVTAMSPTPCGVGLDAGVVSNSDR